MKQEQGDQPCSCFMYRVKVLSGRAAERGEDVVRSAARGCCHGSPVRDCMHAELPPIYTDIITDESRAARVRRGGGDSSVCRETPGHDPRLHRGCNVTPSNDSVTC